uniref:Uncharacterized protein n=1 Tax=Solanum lycopersicum TaxID=4081 RepID=A0A3Q7ETK5_SOLLC
MRETNSIGSMVKFCTYVHQHLKQGLLYIFIFYTFSQAKNDLKQMLILENKKDINWFFLIIFSNK